MFTGLIRTVGTVTALQGVGDVTVTIAGDLPEGDLAMGASVACNGVCLTVIDRTEGTFLALMSTETLDKSTFGRVRVGDRVNLEPSLRLGDALGGHFVFGHVDGLATVVSITPTAESYDVVLALPPDLLPFVAPKGSLAVNGVSLTPNTVEGRHVALRIIPHTWANTTFSSLLPQDAVNIEVDMLARYVHRQRTQTTDAP
ncbi:MAG: riboflavin synthase [Alphaproteobacteria bacterium]